MEIIEYEKMIITLNTLLPDLQKFRMEHKNAILLKVKIIPVQDTLLNL